MAIPYIVVDLDKPRRLRMGMGAMVAFEKMTGKKLQEIAAELSTGDVAMTSIAQLLRAMLLREQPDITIEQTCDLVDDHADKVSAVVRYVVEALSAAFEDKESPNAQTPTDGQNS